MAGICRVGSDAAAIPLPDASCDAMSLHCSFEHFEGTADSGFVREASRLLKPGGVGCIIPLYLSNTYQIVSNPRYWFKEGIPRESGATIVVSRNYWERHGRFYDAVTLQKRVLRPMRDAGLNVEILQVALPPEIDYPSFALLRFTKPEP